MKERGKSLFLVFVLAFLFILILLSFFILSSINFVSAGELRVTEEHPFLMGDEWISASELKVGDELTLLNGSKVVIKSIEDIVVSEDDKDGCDDEENEENVLVYNIEAGKFHNFVVCGEDDCSSDDYKDAGSVGVIVHNSNPIENSIYSPIDINLAKTQDLSDIANQIQAKVTPVDIRHTIPAMPTASTQSTLRYFSISKKRFLRMPSVKPSIELNQPLIDGWKARLLDPADPHPETWETLEEAIGGFRVIKEREFWPVAEKVTKEALDSIDKAILVGSRKPFSSPNYVITKLQDTIFKSGKIEGTIFLQLNGPRSQASKGFFSEFEALLKAGRTKFVTFDDASYSGTELVTEYILPLSNSYKKAKLAGAVFNQKPEIHFIVPYVSAEARKALIVAIKNYPDINIVLHASADVPPMMRNILTDSKITAYNAVIKSLNSNVQRGVVPPPVIDGDYSAFVLEHKVADSMSLGNFGNSGYREGLYRSNFPGYDFKNRITSVYKIPGEPLHNLDTLLYHSNNQKTQTIKQYTDLFVFRIVSILLQKY